MKHSLHFKAGCRKLLTIHFLHCLETTERDVNTKQNDMSSNYMITRHQEVTRKHKKLKKIKPGLWSHIIRNSNFSIKPFETCLWPYKT